jgi:hypothetical protein
MKDYGLDKGLIQFRDDEPRSNRGLTKGFFGFRKMFRDYLTKLNVAFYDACCPELTGQIAPVRYDGSFSELQYFNGFGWSGITIPPEVDVIAEVNNYLQITQTFESNNALIPLIEPGTPEEITGNGTGFVLSSAYLTRWLSTGGHSLTLQGGNQAGRLKKIVMVGGGGGPSTLSVDSAVGFTSIDFNDDGDYVVLITTNTLGWGLVEFGGLAGGGGITINP